MTGSAVRRVLAAVGALVVSAAGVVTPVAANQNAAWVGACAMSLNVSFSPPLTNLIEGHVIGFSGGGTCIVNDQVAPLLFVGGAATIGGMSCAAGLASGSGGFFAFANGFPSPNVQIEFVTVGPTVTMELNSNLIGFDGVAELAGGVEAALCPVNGEASTTWLGAVVFQDPTLPI